MPWYQYGLAAAIHQTGYGADFISEQVLQQARFESGRLWFGKRSYSLLVLEEVATLAPQTARCLQRYVEGGGRIAIIGRAPWRAPGLVDAAANDARVAAALAAARNSAAQGVGRILEFEPPRETPAAHAARAKAERIAAFDLSPAEHRLEDDQLLHWTQTLLAASGVRPFVEIEPARTTVSQVHHLTDDGRALFFFANLSRDQTADFTARFPGIAGTPWRWDAASGRRAPFAGAAEVRRGLRIRLDPQASMLLVFETDPRLAATAAAGVQAEPRLAMDAARAEAALSETRVIAGAWRLELHPAGGGPTLARDLPSLLDFSVQTDPALAHFGGTALYRKTFQLDDDRFDALDLGLVHGASEVVLNGQPLGVRAWGRHVYDARGALRVGMNTLEIKVATQLGNAMKALDPRHAGWFGPIPAGLVGPVALRRRALGQ
jgi:hypothetical protein